MFVGFYLFCLASKLVAQRILMFLWCRLAWNATLGTAVAVTNILSTPSCRLTLWWTLWWISPARKSLILISEACLYSRHYYVLHLMFILEHIHTHYNSYTSYIIYLNIILYVRVFTHMHVWCIYLYIYPYHGCVLHVKICKICVYTRHKWGCSQHLSENWFDFFQPGRSRLPVSSSLATDGRRRHRGRHAMLAASQGWITSCDERWWFTAGSPCQI